MLKDYDLELEFVHKGENKVRFNPLKETKQEDIEWFNSLFQQKVDMVIDQTIATREDKLFSKSSEDKESLKKALTERLAKGETFTDMEELKSMGLIDDVTTPDEYLSEQLFKGKKYSIGIAQANFLKKLASGKGAYAAGEGVSGFIRETIFADINLEEESESSIYN